MGGAGVVGGAEGGGRKGGGCRLGMSCGPVAAAYVGGQCFSAAGRWEASISSGPYRNFVAG